MMAAKVSLVLFLSFLSTLSFCTYVQAYPLHASCKVQWTFPSVTCESFSSKITTQAAAWKSADNCANGGEKCLYDITSTTADEIKGTHETPVKHYKDDISFKMTKNGDGCNVEGFSTSQTWYAYLDYSTNYCNLNNLITDRGQLCHHNSYVPGCSLVPALYCTIYKGPLNMCSISGAGAGLDTTQGYTETTSDDVCTQYSSRNCEKY